MTSGGNGLGAGRLGVLGVGHIGGAIARGLLHAGLAPGRILLAPRGADAAGLGLVFLCVRSPLAVDVVAGLPWRRGQLLISTCAGVSRRTLAAAAGAPEIVRAMPMMSAATGASPTVMFPDHPRSASILGMLGRVTPLGREEEFAVATAVAVAFTFCHELVGRTADWAIANGLDPAVARMLPAAHFVAAAAAMGAEGAGSYGAVVAALATPGGLAEAGLAQLRARDFADTWRAAFDAALAQVEAIEETA
jgi:pyrroline-5-carboxylate reductase